jgi:hypothetical protein
MLFASSSIAAVTIKDSKRAAAVQVRLVSDCNSASDRTSGKLQDSAMRHLNISLLGLALAIPTPIAFVLS